MYDDDLLDEDMLIMSDREFEDGNPIVRGTHITVERILLLLAKGMTRKQILEEYPELTPEGFKAAMRFAIESVRFDHVTPFEDRGGEEGC